LYKNEGWKGYGDWVGNGVISNQNKIFLSYVHARNYAQKLKLETVKQWNEYFRNNSRPLNIPRNPSQAYKKKGWISWKDFLGKK
jgi:hypothetical protein